MKAYKPVNLEEALQICRDEQVTPFAGGTDVMVKGLRGSGLIPKTAHPVLFLSGIAELREWRDKGDTLFLGSCMTYTDLYALPLLPALLKAAIREIGSPGIRNLGTLGGNICNASPAGDTLPVLYILNAQVRIADDTGTRDIPVSEFIQGPGKTILESNELVVGVTVPRVHFSTHFYRKVGTRKANALSKLSCAGGAAVSGEKITDFRIAFGAVAPTVIRPYDLEKRICSMTVPELREECGEVVKEFGALIKPIDDQRSSASYRSLTAEKLLAHFINSLD